MEIVITLIVGFALGYGVREWISRHDTKRKDSDGAPCDPEAQGVCGPDLTVRVVGGGCSLSR